MTFNEPTSIYLTLKVQWKRQVCHEESEEDTGSTVIVPQVLRHVSTWEA